MEKIKYDYFRYNIIAVPMILAAIAFSIFVSGSPAMQVIPFFVGLILFLNLVLYILDNRKWKAVYFSPEGLTYHVNKEKVFLKWEELKVISKKSLLSDMELVFRGPVGDEKKVSIHTFQAKSLINLTKNYCPPNHEFYRVISEYAYEKGNPL